MIEDVGQNLLKNISDDDFFYLFFHNLCTGIVPTLHNFLL